MSVEQPFGPTPTPAWARSEPAGYPQPPDPVPAGSEPAVEVPAVEVPAVEVPAVSEATASGLEAGPDPALGTVGQDVETNGVVASDGVPDDVDGPVEQRVRGQVAALDGIADLPLSEHAQRYDEVHAELQAALTEIDGESS